jgi:hypothetical protein
MSKRAASVGSWWLADHQLLCPGRLVPRQGPGSPSVPGRPEGPALQLQHSGQLDLQDKYIDRSSERWDTHHTMFLGTM